MKRTKEKVEKQEEDEERQHLYQDNLVKLDEDVNKVIHLVSYYDCKEVLPCRLSFGGFDPEIEKINEDLLTGLYKVEKKEIPQEPEADVSSADVMESSFGAKIGQKFKKGQSRNDGFRLNQKRPNDGNNFGPRHGQKRRSDGDNFGPRHGQKRRSDEDNSGSRFGQKQQYDTDNFGPRVNQKWGEGDDASKSKFLKPSDD
ncbi:M-phase phosphoprotein 6 isoform X2 [Oratosquilla oratoria]